MPCHNDNVDSTFVNVGGLDRAPSCLVGVARRGDRDAQLSKRMRLRMKLLKINFPFFSHSFFAKHVQQR